MSAGPSSIFSLPLFPLHHVLFPQFLLRLHVFEDRYKAMIGNCIERDQPFGVVLIRSGEEVGRPSVPHEVGCVARILEVQPLDDGRMNLLAMGQGRFRLLDYGEADLPYLIGRVKAMEDSPIPPDALAPLSQQLMTLFQRYLGLLAERAGASVPEMTLPDDPTLLAFCIASVTQLSPLEKQRLLGTTDARARLRAEIRLLRRQIAELETSQSRAQGGSETGSGIQTIVARPIDSDQERWQRFRHDGRN